MIFYYNAFHEHAWNYKPLCFLPIDTDELIVTVSDSLVRIFIIILVLFFSKAKILKNILINLMGFKIWCVKDSYPS